MNIGKGQLVGEPTRQTEISQAMNELSQINLILLDRLSLLSERIQTIRTAKPTNPTPKDENVKAAPCQLAQEIRSNAITITQAVNIINTILEEIEL